MYVVWAYERKFLLDHALSMDNVGNRRLFSISLGYRMNAIVYSTSDLS